MTSLYRLRDALPFGLQEAIEAEHQWGANCGPGAIAAICGITPADAVAAIPNFSKKRYTTELMLQDALDSLNVRWKQAYPTWPQWGFARVVWSGPWMTDPDPFVALSHSHWVGVYQSEGELAIFDINAISAGGWISWAEWHGSLVPWLLSHAEPEAGRFFCIHEAYEVDAPPRDQRP